MSQRLTCQKCKRNYKMLADGVCFYCDKDRWYKYFKKFEKK